MASLAQLYCNECVIHNCLTNSAVLSYFQALDLDHSMPAAVDLSSNYLGDRNIAALCTVLSTLPSVESLTLAGMDIELDGVASVCKLASKHRGIRYIDLRRNPIYASAGRALQQLVIVNPAITQLLFDADTMPARVASAIHKTIGANIARAHPCTEQTCADALASTQCFEPLSFTASPVLTQFQQQILTEAETRLEQLLECYVKAGMFACQFFVDFGPDAFDLLLSSITRFECRSREVDSGGEPAYVVAQALLRDEIGRLVNDDLLKRIEGTLLVEQLHAAQRQIGRISSDEDVTAVMPIVIHVRNVIRDLRSATQSTVDEEASRMRKAMIREWEHTRRLQPLGAEARYLLMDFPTMTEDVVAIRQTCQSPLRRTTGDLKEKLVRLARRPFAQARRKLLQEFRNVCAPQLLEGVQHAFISSTLNQAIGVSALHATGLQIEQRDWVELVSSCTDAAAVGALVETWAGAARYARWMADASS
jgi:hypothetical protein